MEADNAVSKRESYDAEWIARHSRLDASLTATIRAPVVDERFDERVWALIRAREAESSAVQGLLRMRLGAPWWLDSLNVIAIAATVAAIVLALGTIASGPVAESAAETLALVKQPSESLRFFAVVASAGALWFGVREAPFVRAFVRGWL